MATSVIDAGQRIHDLRAHLKEDLAILKIFTRRYRPTPEKVWTSSILHETGTTSLMRRFQLGGSVWELIEFVSKDGATERAFVVDYQTEKLHSFNRYLDAEIMMVDLMAGI